MKLAALALTLLVLTPTYAHSLDGTIGIYADQGLSVCSANLDFQVPLTLYVYALPAGASASGITGAEYSISTSEATNWLWTEDFSPAISTGAITVGPGAIFGTQPGINVAWGTCQNPGGAILLQSITVFDAIGGFVGTPNLLQIEAHSSPGNPFFRCPLFNLCDAPTFTKVCLGDSVTMEVCPFPPGALACQASTSGQFLLNPIGGSCDCGALENCLPTAVEGRTWGEVKGLYRSTKQTTR